MKLISALLLLFSAYAVPEGDSDSSDNWRDELIYVPRATVARYAEKLTTMEADFSKEDHAYILKYYADQVESEPSTLAKWQLRILRHLEDFFWSAKNIQIGDVMDLLTKPVIKSLSNLMNFPKGSDYKRSFQSSLDRDVCITKDFISKLDATQFNHNFLGTLIGALIHQQRSISHPEDYEENDGTMVYPNKDPRSDEYNAGLDSRLKCFNALIEITASIVKTYSQGDITLDMLVKDDLLGWKISGEEFFKFPHTYGKHMELIYMTTTNTYQETFASHLLRYGSAKVIANMILLNISFEDIVSQLPHHTCIRGFLDKLLLNKNLTPEDRRLFLEALLPLFNTMNSNCLRGANWNSISHVKTYLTDFGLIGQLSVEEEKLVKQLENKYQPSEGLSEKQIQAYDRGTLILGERLGLKKSLYCPVYALEHVYNLKRRNLLEEKQKKDVCSITDKCIEGHADVPLWSQLDVKYQTAEDIYEELCNPSILKQLQKKGFLSSAYLESELFYLENILLKELKERAGGKEVAERFPTRLPDDNFRRKNVVFKSYLDEVSLHPFSLPILEDVIYMINESEDVERVNPFVMRQILKSKFFVEYLKSLSKERQLAIARIIYFKSLKPQHYQRNELYQLFLSALGKVDDDLLKVFLS